MGINWFKRRAKQDAQLDSLAASIDALCEAVSTNEQGMQKGLRRLAIAQKQQSDTLEQLVQESSSLQHTLTQQGLAFTAEQIIKILDNLAKIECAAHPIAQAQAVLAPMVAHAADELLALCAWKAIVTRGKPYPDQACEVIGAIEQSQYAPGVVIDIVQQGYQTLQGQVVRAAKVIVASSTASAMASE